MGILGSKIGVDIGSTAIRAVEISGVDADGFAVVTKAYRYPLAPGAVSGGEYQQPLAVADALNKLFTRAKLQRQGAVLGFGTPTTVVGEMSLPASVQPEERTMALRYSTEQLSPSLSLQDAAISWNVIGHYASPTTALESRKLMVAIADKEQIEVLSGICKAAKIQPQAFDLDAAALLRSTVRTPPTDANKVTTIVDVGATRTMVITRRGQHIVGLITDAHGGDLVTKTLQGALELTPAEAESRKRLIRIAGTGGTSTDLTSVYAQGLPSQEEILTTEATKVVSLAAGSLIETIANAMSAAPQSAGVHLIGGAARLPGFAEKLSERVGVQVMFNPPWVRVKASDKTKALTEHGDPSDEALSEFSNAIGLAMWRPPR